MHSEDIALHRLARALRDRLTPAAVRPVADVEVTAWEAGAEPVAAATALRAPYRPFSVGQRWGRPWETTWFRMRGPVPPADRGGRVELVVDLGWQDDALPGFQAEGLAYRPDGSVIKAVQPRTNWVPVPGDEVDVFLEAAANPQVFGRPADRFRPTPLGDVRTAGGEPL
jgi:alpha-mannosidase